MPDPPPLSEAEKRSRLAELAARLEGTTLPDDFTNGATDTVLLRFLAARGFDVDKAHTVRVLTWRARTRRGGRARACVTASGRAVGAVGTARAVGLCGAARGRAACAA
jgi:hypothetical protein